MHRRIVCLCTCVLCCFFLVPHAGATFRSWSGSGDGVNWFDADNWNPTDNYPQDGDNVTISGATVVLSNDTAWLAGLTVTNGTLAFTNWSTRLLATNITIQSNGVLRPAASYLGTEMSNRVYAVCSNLVVKRGGRIHADELGFGADGLISYGEGAGVYGSNRGSGGSYGGRGGFANTIYVAPPEPYGSAAAPVKPGSAGGRGHTSGPEGGSGGGAIRIVATNVVLNGTISAAGGAGETYGGAGSGGGIYITCSSFMSTGESSRPKAACRPTISRGAAAAGASRSIARTSCCRTTCSSARRRETARGMRARWARCTFRIPRRFRNCSSVVTTYGSSWVA